MKVTAEELAAALGVSPRTLRRWVAAGAVDAPTLGRAWSAEGAALVARACKVAVPPAWAEQLTPEQRARIGWAA